MKIKLLIFILLSSIAPVKGQSFFDVDWRTSIDTTWEHVYSTERMLEIFDSVWTIIHNEYACFQGLDTDWESLRQTDRREIESGVSRGRFTAILNYFGIKLKESHTYIGDPVINQNMKPKRGTPLIFQGGRGTVRTSEPH